MVVKVTARAKQLMFTHDNRVIFIGFIYDYDNVSAKKICYHHFIILYLDFMNNLDL